MRNRRFRGITVMLSALMLVATMFVAAAAANENGPDVERHGQCSGAARWELEADDDGARLEMEFDVNATKAGAHWKVKLSHDGTVFERLVKVTNHHGNFEVERRVTDTSGTDTLGARAVSPSGQVCKASLSI